MSGHKENKFLDLVLKLEKVKDGHYKSVFQVSHNAVFGGQIVALGVVAASDTVPSNYYIHNLHSSFLKRGEDKSIVYKVKCIKDNETISIRSVNAVQNDRTIFFMQCVFKKSATENACDKPSAIPKVPHPDVLKSKTQLLEGMLMELKNSSDGKLMEKIYHEKVTDSFCKRFFEFKPIDSAYYKYRLPCEPKLTEWIKCRINIGNDQQLQRIAAIYVSDEDILESSVNPKPGLESYNFASLNHSVWFHNNVNVNNWMLFDSVSPIAGKGRTFALGRFWSQDGHLLMTVAQEAVLRSLKPKI